MDLQQLKSLETRLKQITETKVENLLAKEILRNGNDIVQLVRNRWLLGKRPDGSIIGEYASFEYEQEKLIKNPSAGGNVDLIDTGSLESKLVVNHIRNSLFNIFSKDVKAVSIAEKYGLDVYGVTNKEEKEIMFIASKNVMTELFQFVRL